MSAPTVSSFDGKVGQWLALALDPYSKAKETNFLAPHRDYTEEFLLVRRKAAPCRGSAVHGTRKTHSTLALTRGICKQRLAAHTTNTKKNRKKIGNLHDEALCLPRRPP